MRSTWTLDDALKLVRAIQEKTREFGYHVALGGGVLNIGESEKDVDLYFMPMSSPEYTEKPNDLLAWLETLWGKGVPLGDYGAKPATRGNDGLLRMRAPNRDGVTVQWVRRVNANQEWEWFIEDDVPEPMAPPEDAVEWARRLGKNKTKEGPSVYKFKMKFIRKMTSNDRIDVFIL